MDLRCFIAVEFPDEVKGNIGAFIERLRATKADVRWVSSKNLHLTLKFLGNTPEEIIPGVNKKLSEAARLHNSFQIQLFGAGVFPNAKLPRVVWLGIRDSDEMVNLQKDVDESMKEFGFEPEDREFRPHLTIGRVKSPKNKDILMKELAILKEADFGKINVESIVLMKSELKPAGAEYSRLSEIRIGK